MYTFSGLKEIDSSNPEKAELRRDELRSVYYLEGSKAAGSLERFRKEKAEYRKPIKTGYAVIDTMLSGGLYRGLYIIAAMSSMGKTTLLHNIADNISEQGQDVLYFSLEMGETELTAKSLSRESYILDSKNAWTARQFLTNEIQKGSNADKAYYKLMEKSGGVYIITEDSEIKTKWNEDGSLESYLREPTGAVSLDGIRQRAKEHKELTGKTPVIMLDYLQILRPSDPRTSDKQAADEAVRELCSIARELKTPVLALSSISRGSYDKEITLASLKESGGIEYGADYVIAMQPAKDGQDRPTADELKRCEVRKIELTVLKARLDSMNTGEVIATYNAKYNYFEFELNPYKPENPVKNSEKLI